MNKTILTTLLMAACCTTMAQQLAKGNVYVDENKNGKKDKREVGLAGVPVSNGFDVVLTDAEGNYKIAVQEDNQIFVIKPSGYALPLDADNHPKFYYTYKPKGSPELKYPGVAPTGKLPSAIDFALYKQEEANKFSAFVFGDPQAYTLEELAYFKKGIIDEAKERKGLLFGISLGDLVGDDLSLHPAYKKTVGGMGMPWYNVMGNHDMNYDVTVDSLADETFEANFGPNTYAFNYGKTHFIVLDNIIYPNPNSGKGYLGGFRKDQLDFVENDLKHVPEDHLVVLAFHIPLNNVNENVFRAADRQRLFDILARFPHTLSLSAHTHFQTQHFYTAKDGWKQDTPHHEYNVGTTSGDWYSGQLNAQGVPTSTMRDGTPKGFAMLHIDEGKYSFDYKVAGAEDSYQIQVFGPQVVKEKYAKRYPLYANFFIGKTGDKVTYKINDGNWKEMDKVLDTDPKYVANLLQYDGAKELVEGRRPSNAVVSSHLWSTKLPALKEGSHIIQIQAVDMFGRTHSQTHTIEVVK